MSNDQKTLYVVVKSASSDDYAYLLRLDTATQYDPGVVEALSKVAGRRHPARM